MVERKTIGSFIATLRKANGMTQKELAEKLNVSDKTVSRWEREDGVPDLSVIPVIAEIFGVTCDELLRGERKPQNQVEEGNPGEQLPGGKGEKQRRRILAVGLSKYKTKTFIAIGVSIVGLLAAMIGNLVFLRAYAGFFLSMVFYLAAIICQAIFVNYAFLAVDDEEWKAEEIGSYRRNVVRLAEWSIGLTVVLLVATVPLVLLIHDTYMGLSAESWLLYGGCFGVAALLAVSVICFILNGKLFQKANYFPGEKEEKVYKSNHLLAGKCAMIMALVLLATAVAHNLATAGGSAYAMSEGTEFYDYESFGEFMARPEARIYYEGDMVIAEEVVPGSSTYYDEQGNVITEEEANTRELHDSKGNVVYSYVHRNENVCSVRYSDIDGNLLPITVITYDDLQIGRGKLEVANTLFVFLYCVEILIGAVIYFKKRI